MIAEVTTDLPASLPEGSRLVHIGFPKTGTTSLQYALATARDDLSRHGVVYPGTERYHKNAGIYIAQAVPRRGEKPPNEREWTAVVEQAREAGEARVMISSEWLSEAPDDGVARLIDDLGGAGQVQIVATLRPLSKILPSSWQQYLQNGMPVSYEAWLTGMLVTSPFDKPTASFWRRHSHDTILSRWSKYAGAENVTAIVVDSRDHGGLLRQFETMLDLPPGFLRLQPSDKDNRSMSWPEAEMVRLVNKTIREDKWPDAVFRSVVRLGVVDRLMGIRSNDETLPTIGIPEWAAERAAEIGTRFAATIRELGIRVVGDLDSLGSMPSQADTATRPPAMVPGDIAAEAILAAIESGIEYGNTKGQAAAKVAADNAAAKRAADPRAAAVRATPARAALTGHLRRVAARARDQLRRRTDLHRLDR
jgi:hypothetical protein